jgi:hypothetical protein
MLEALLFAAGVSTTATNPQAKQAVATPTVELLEFIADWSEPEARQLLDPKYAEAPLPSLEHTRSPSKKREPVHER